MERGFGLIYDVERDITWLKDANYAKTAGRTPDGQMSWNTAMAWVSGLAYHGISGWRLPTALDPDGSGPFVGSNCTRGELGHLFFVASLMPAGSVSAVDFNSFSIYWTSTEASPSEAYAFRLVGLRQGQLVKDPFAPDPALGAPPVLTDVVLAWPVHDGDVAAALESRWLKILGLLSPWRWVRWSSVTEPLTAQSGRPGATLSLDVKVRERVAAASNTVPTANLIRMAVGNEPGDANVR